MNLMITSYLMDGIFRATRHAPTCKVMLRTMDQVMRGGDPRFPGLAVVEEDKYSLRPGSENRPTKDHSCVNAWLAEHPVQLTLSA